MMFDKYKALLKQGCSYKCGTVQISTEGIIASPSVLNKMGSLLDVDKCNHPDMNGEPCSTNCPLVKENK